MDTVVRRRRKKLDPDPGVRDALVNAATEIVRDEGVASINVARVLTRAQLSTRAFYRHFDSKDALVSAVFLQMARAEMRRLKRRMASASNPADAVVAWIDGRLDLAFNAQIRSDLRQMSLEAQTQMFAAPELISDAYGEILKPLVEQLEKGRAAGLFPDIDPPADALSIHGAIWASVERQWATGDCDQREVREQVVRFCMRGIGVVRLGKVDAMDLGLAGSTAVVTGGSKGMGLAIAMTLAEEGAKVAVMARGAAALDDAAAKLRAAGAPDAVGISVDMSDAESIAAGFDAVAQRWGELNSLVHTIGPGDGYFEEMDDSQWEDTFALGTMSGVRSIRAALPMLRAAEWARIVTLSAHSIQRQNPRIVAYTASKAALSSVTKNLSKSLAKDGILVNCVCPGTIVTASFTEVLKDILAADGLDATDPTDVMTWIDNNFHQPCDLGRAGLPEEIASITVYLASKRNGYVTGATVNVDGGSDFV